MSDFNDFNVFRSIWTHGGIPRYVRVFILYTGMPWDTLNTLVNLWSMLRWVGEKLEVDKCSKVLDSGDLTFLVP